MVPNCNETLSWKLKILKSYQLWGLLCPYHLLSSPEVSLLWSRNSRTQESDHKTPSGSQWTFHGVKEGNWPWVPGSQEWHPPTPTPLRSGLRQPQVLDSWLTLGKYLVTQPALLHWRQNSDSSVLVGIWLGHFGENSLSNNKGKDYVENGYEKKRIHASWPPGSLSATISKSTMPPYTLHSFR